MTEATFLPCYQSLSDLIHSHASNRPTARAVEFAGRSLSWSELDLIGRCIGAQLNREGIKPGEHVGLLAKNTDAYFELLAGCSHAQCVLTPINWRLSPDEIAFILKDAEIRVLFVSSEYCDLARQLLSDLDHEIRLFVLDGAERSDCTHYQSGATLNPRTALPAHPHRLMYSCRSIRPARPVHQKASS